VKPVPVYRLLDEEQSREASLGHVTVIYKPVQFDSRGRVAAGQSQPDSDGWRLVSLATETGVESLLFVGYYEHCRELQLRIEMGEDVSEVSAGLEKEAETRRKRSSSFIRRVSGKFKGRSV
jgi:hypothetical protein